MWLICILKLKTITTQKNEKDDELHVPVFYNFREEITGLGQAQVGENQVEFSYFDN